MKQPAAPGDKHDAPEGAIHTGEIDTAVLDQLMENEEARNAIHKDAPAVMVVAGRPITMLDMWQVRSFKYARQRGYDFPDGTGSQTRLAEVVVELGNTGIYQTGIGIVERSYNQTATPILRGRKGKVVQLNTRQVGGGNNRANIPIFEAASETGRTAIKAWKAHVVAEFNLWLKANDISDTATSSDVFDEVDK